MKNFWSTHDYGKIYTKFFNEEWLFLTKNQQEIIKTSPQGKESANLAIKVQGRCEEFSRLWF